MAEENESVMTHTAIPVDPRTVAEALRIETTDLARMLTRWADEALPTLEYDRSWAPPRLDYFDEQVATARAYLVDAHEAQKAWEIDNPPDENE
jgi:hypothetical protein